MIFGKKAPKTIYAENHDAQSYQTKRRKSRVILPLCDECFKVVQSPTRMPDGSILCAIHAEEYGKNN